MAIAEIANGDCGQGSAIFACASCTGLPVVSRRFYIYAFPAPADPRPGLIEVNFRSRKKAVRRRCCCRALAHQSVRAFTTWGLRPVRMRSFTHSQKRCSSAALHFLHGCVNSNLVARATCAKRHYLAPPRRVVDYAKPALAACAKLALNQRGLCNSCVSKTETSPKKKARDSRNTSRLPTP